jgi:hypothetical protein
MRSRKGFFRSCVAAVVFVIGAGAGVCGAGSAAYASGAPAGHEAMQPSAHTSAMPHLSYWGGRELRNARVVIVVWGGGIYQSQVTATAAPNSISFFSGIERSSYVDWLREYNTSLDPIGRGSVVGRYTIAPSARNNGAHVDDVANIRPELAAQIRAHHLPAPDANTVYALYFRRGQVITQGGTDSTRGFCAYHSTVRWSSSTNVRYMALPASASGTHCGPYPGFGNLSIAASHELLEVTTDPDVGLATHLGPPLGWYDRSYGEVADICAGMPAAVRGGDGRTYVVQKAWSNRRRACVSS